MSMPKLSISNRINTERLGLVGVIGIGLLLFCLSFALGTVIPAQQEAQNLRAEETKLAMVLTTFKVKSLAHDAMALPPPVLPGLMSAPELVDQLNDLAAKNNLAIEHTSYHLDDKENLRRIEVSLPLRGDYPSLRNYLRDAMALSDRTTLDSLSLQRAKSSDPQLDANVQLSYYFSTP